MAKLRVLFNGYASVPPTLFIFCGNFISKPFGSKHSCKLRGNHDHVHTFLIFQRKLALLALYFFLECFNDLSDLISEFPSLVERFLKATSSVLFAHFILQFLLNVRP